jgi:hypothetical protein
MPIGGVGPSKKTPETVKKIEEAAALDASMEEIAFYAGISKQTLYDWLKDDPDLRERVDALRQKPVLKARQAVVRGLDDPGTALKYLERKRRDEFAVRKEHTVETKPVDVSITPEEREKMMRLFPSMHPRQTDDERSD